MVFVLACFLLSWLATAAPAVPPAPQDYLSLLERAVGCLERGSARDALEPLLAAQTLDNAHPLVHVALGLAYLRTGEVQTARQAYGDAVAWCRRSGPLDADTLATAHLGLSIAALAANQPVQAALALRQAGQNPSAQIAAAYLEALRGRPQAAAALAARPADDSFALAVAGAALEAAGRCQEACGLLQQACRSLPGGGFDPPADARVLPRLSNASLLGNARVARLLLRTRGEGSVTVEVELPRGLGAQYAGMLVDGQLRGMTNTTPYVFHWRPEEAGPGWHTLAVRTFNASGQVCGQAATSQLVGSAPVELYPAARYRSLLTRLARMTRPLPSAAFVHYHLARCYEHMGHQEQALRHLEEAVAVYPQYLDARPRLLALSHRLRRISAAPDLRSVPARKGRAPRVALTFDDGPHPTFTPRVLALLRRYHAQGTFFLVGMQVATFPELARSIAAGGHELANHTYTHPNLEGLGPVGIQLELLRARVALRNATGRDTHLFRPPGGRYNGEIRQAICQLGYRVVLWSNNILSYKSRDPSVIARQMVAETRDGSVLLLHNGEDYTVQVLPTLLAELSRRGYRFVTVSELLAAQ